MPNYRRRFTKKEFQEEYARHLGDVPPGLLKSKKRLEAVADLKASYYEQALAALDVAVARIKDMSVKDSDGLLRDDAEDAIRQIKTAIDTFGESSMVKNSKWDGTGG